MTKLVANVGLLAMGMGATLGNYWFTYGLWPKSWLSFFGFGVIGVVLLSMRLATDKD